MLVVVKTKLMTNLRNLNNKLTTNLGLISSKIALENSVNDQSLNILLENPLLEILNFIYNYKQCYGDLSWCCLYLFLGNIYAFFFCYVKKFFARILGYLQISLFLRLFN